MNLKLVIDGLDYTYTDEGGTFDELVESIAEKIKKGRVTAEPTSVGGVVIINWGQVKACQVHQAVGGW